MQIRGPSNPVRLVLEQLKTELVQQLRPGQMLKATVLSENQSGMLKLALGNTTVTAQTALRLPPGSIIQLEVTRAGQQPELRALLPASPEAIQAQALRNSLPKAQPLPHVFEQFQKAQAQPESVTLPRPIQQALAQILGNAVGYQALGEPRELARLLGASGLLFESTLSKGTPVAADLKSSLLRLLALLQNAAAKPNPSAQPQSTATSAATPTPEAPIPRLSGELLALVESALARVELNQLASLPTNNAGQPVWQFELPVLTERGYESVWLQINRDGEAETDTQGGAGWNVNLQLNLANLGRVRAGIHLLGEAVRASFVAEQAETALLFNDNLDTLRRGLNRAGLEVTRLDVHQGRVAPPQPFASTRQTLLDERA